MIISDLYIMSKVNRDEIGVNWSRVDIFSFLLQTSFSTALTLTSAEILCINHGDQSVIFNLKSS